MPSAIFPPFIAVRLIKNLSVEKIFNPDNETTKDNYF